MSSLGGREITNLTGLYLEIKTFVFLFLAIYFRSYHFPFCSLLA